MDFVVVVFSSCYRGVYENGENASAALACKRLKLYAYLKLLLSGSTIMSESAALMVTSGEDVAVNPRESQNWLRRDLMF